MMKSKFDIDNIIVVINFFVVFLISPCYSFAQDEINVEKIAQQKLSAMMRDQSDEDMERESKLLLELLGTGSAETVLEGVISFFGGGSAVSECEDKVKIAIAASLDVTTALFVEEEARKAKIEIKEKKEEQKHIKTDRAIVSTTTAIYEGYKTLLMYIEQISEAYQTFTYANKVFEDIKNACIAYQNVSFDGVVRIHTFYDLDKWLDPYQKRARRLYLVSYLDRLENITDIVKKILAPVSEGGFRAGDSWRMRKLEEFDKELRGMISGIYRMHNWCMSCASANKQTAFGIILDEACWDFDSYYYRRSYERVNTEGWKYIHDISEDDVNASIASISE